MKQQTTFQDCISQNRTAMSGLYAQLAAQEQESLARIEQKATRVMDLVQRCRQEPVVPLLANPAQDGQRARARKVRNADAKRPSVKQRMGGRAKRVTAKPVERPSVKGSPIKRPANITRDRVLVA